MMHTSDAYCSWHWLRKMGPCSSSRIVSDPQYTAVMGVLPIQQTVPAVTPSRRKRYTLITEQSLRMIYITANMLSQVSIHLDLMAAGLMWDACSQGGEEDHRVQLEAQENRVMWKMAHFCSEKERALHCCREEPRHCWLKLIGILRERPLSAQKPCSALQISLLKDRDGYLK